MATDLGKTIVTNSSIQMLMKQSPASIDRLAEIFYLSEGEKSFLLSTNVGEGLFFAGNSHVAMRVVSSPDEYKLITTKPQEILKEQAAQKTPTQVIPLPITTPTPVPEVKEETVTDPNAAISVDDLLKMVSKPSDNNNPS